jgi:hypothetical protein
MDKCRVVNTSYLASLEKHWLSIVFFLKKKVLRTFMTV